MEMDMFAGRTLLIVTKHDKEKVIAPLLEHELGVNCIVTTNFDTDQLGTFTGEIEREDDPLTTVRKKCLLAMELANCDLALASEGSFGPHPNLFLASSGDELVILIDKKNKLEIVGRELSTETNFAGEDINSLEALKDFATRVHFPSHGLILRKHRDDFSGMKKDIFDWKNLFDSYEEMRDETGKVYIETDMRASSNPTRLKNIARATQDLMEKIKSCCPECGTPGFSVTQIEKGLPCESCSFPTASTLTHVYSCLKCNFKTEVLNPQGKMVEDPEFCDVCNP